jgi:hypothetical protein
MKKVLAVVAVLAICGAGHVCADEQASITTTYPVELYGFIKLDASYDTGATDAGNYNRWVQSGDADNQFNMTANQSRFGLKFKGPDASDAVTSGRVEIDFYGGGAENKSHLMMRHAYMQVEWPQEKFKMIAGQTSDIIAPLVPATLNYSVAWWAGDIGYRRPQVQASKTIGVANDVDALFQVALARTIGDGSPFGNGAASSDTGEDSGVPSLQGRAALTFPFLTEQDTTIGLSGHWGEEEFDRSKTDNDGTHLQTWSVGLDAIVPLTNAVTLAGELWTGENLDAYLGGIAQGIVIQTDAAGAYADSHVVESSGGWISLDIQAAEKVKVGVGASIDDPDGSRNLSTGARVQNSSVWSNVRYSFNEAIDVGLELSYWDTQYKHRRDGDSIRMQTSFIYSF